MESELSELLEEFEINNGHHMRIDPRDIYGDYDGFKTSTENVKGSRLIAGEFDQFAIVKFK